MTRVRLVADDLTGALDAAAPFAAPDAPLPVLWSEEAAREREGSFALDTESREGNTLARLEEALPLLSDAGCALKKIDSLLRGNTLAELALCLESGRFASTVIAPAFPAQQRITRGGRQLWRRSGDLPWQPVAVDLVQGLQGLGVRGARDAGEVRGEGAFLCDAESEADLGRIAAAGSQLATPILWVGTAGLARALAGTLPSPPAAGLTRPLLVIIGSHHPVTLAQVDALAAARPEAVVRLGLQEDPDPPIARIRQMLGEAGAAALILDVPDGTGAHIAGPAFDRAFARAAALLPPPAGLIVSGGATLHRLVQALEARALLCEGEILPGIARSTLEGGRWPGAVVVSKSGGFGSAEVLTRLIGGGGRS
jgi:D-threonate/D-erythronate kinase